MNRLATSPARRLAAGSTLLELIVVLAIMGLLFGAAIPALAALPEDRAMRSPNDSLRAVAAAEGRLVRGDSALAFPDGRLLLRRAADAR